MIHPCTVCSLAGFALFAELCNRPAQSDFIGHRRPPFAFDPVLMSLSLLESETFLRLFSFYDADIFDDYSHPPIIKHSLFSVYFLLIP